MLFFSNTRSIQNEEVASNLYVFSLFSHFLCVNCQYFDSVIINNLQSLERFSCISLTAHWPLNQCPFLNNHSRLSLQYLKFTLVWDLDLHEITLKLALVTVTRITVCWKIFKSPAYNWYWSNSFYVYSWSH